MCMYIYIYIIGRTRDFAWRVAVCGGTLRGLRMVIVFSFTIIIIIAINNYTTNNVLLLLLIIVGISASIIIIILK